MLTRPSFLILLACAFIHVSTVPLGVCMFTMDCLRINGTALGVCGDRFYFGSCCVVPVLDDELNTVEQQTRPALKRQQASATSLLEMRDQEGRSLSSYEEIEDESENY